MVDYNSTNTGAVIDAAVDKIEATTATAVELSYCASVTSAIQTQMDTKITDSSTDILTNKTLTSPNLNEAVAVTSTATELNILDGATLTTTELNYVDGVTSDIQTQIDTKITISSTDALTNKTIPSGTNQIEMFTEQHAASHTLSAAECYGATYYVTSAATLTLPAVVEGMSLTVITIGAVAVSVDPNASDKIWLDGTALDDGDKITNASTAGDVTVLTYYSADGWHASTNGWTDDGA